MKGFFDQIFCDFDEKYSLMVEDDGRVCYAYLMADNKIIGDPEELEAEWTMIGGQLKEVTIFLRGQGQGREPGCLQ